ncbi:MAG: aminoglycoside phosphotransferase family protein [Anaerolineae bacterium]|nr:aminoglycoside phosphotransferase family protein [Anaerolineae bacterium]
MPFETFDISMLTDLVLPYFQVDPVTLTFIPLKTGKHNSSYWVNTDKERFVLRIAPPDDAGFLFYEKLMMRQEPDLHALIQAKTTIPVAEVIGYDFSRTRLNRDYLLLAALPGTPLSDTPGLTRTMVQRAFFQVGEYLRQLHALTAADVPAANGHYGYLGAHQPMEPQSSWAQAFRVMWHKLLDDVVACGGYTEEEGRTMRQLLELHLEHFNRPVTPSLLHMDVWSQNILIDRAGNVTGLVDFDRALWGDVEIEFAVLDYCGVSVPAFWEGYGRPRDESPPAMIRNQFYLLYEVQKYIPIHIWRRNDPTGAASYKQQSLQLAAQLLPG